MTTYSLYSHSSAGPALVSYAGPFQSAISFKVTSGGCWFEGWWWWVPTGGDTGSQKFALWNIYVAATTGNLLVASATSGTFTANAWNFVSLSTPVQLAVGAQYQAVTGWTAVNGFPDTNSQFGPGDTYSSGITSGPLFAYSDTSNGGSGPTLQFVQGQGQFGDVSGATDPTVYAAMQQSNSANFGIDLEISDTAPSGYAGSYRIWPNFAGVGPQYNNQVDANDAYILGIEFSLSEACTLDKLWFYSPPSGSSQLPTQCVIWDVSTQTMVSGTLQTSPSWSGAAKSGWVSVSYSGVTLPAGDYKASVWNASASGSGTGWNTYTVDYFTTGDGTSNIVTGPITVPNVTNATSPGQGTYATSTSTFLYPNTYVATEGQSYWVDAEVTPSSSAATPTIDQQFISRYQHPHPPHVRNTFIPSGNNVPNSGNFRVVRFH